MKWESPTKAAASDLSPWPDRNRSSRPIWSSPPRARSRICPSWRQRTKRRWRLTGEPSRSIPPATVRPRRRSLPAATASAVPPLSSKPSTWATVQPKGSTPVYRAGPWRPNPASTVGRFATTGHGPCAQVAPKAVTFWILPNGPRVTPRWKVDSAPTKQERAQRCLRCYRLCVWE
jgi:hypothetical protein